jgi:hypothetical protein
MLVSMQWINLPIANSWYFRWFRFFYSQTWIVRYIRLLGQNTVKRARINIGYKASGVLVNVD